MKINYYNMKYYQILQIIKKINKKFKVFLLNLPQNKKNNPFNLNLNYLRII